MGSSAGLSASLIVAPHPTDESQRLAGVDLHAHQDSASSAPREGSNHRDLEYLRYRFCEFFAGDAALTSAVVQAGVPASEPDDIATGGTDFQQKSEVNLLLAELHSLLASGMSILVHLAPPCSTFSRARDRSTATRLRSAEFPQGIPRHAARSREANLVARNALDLVESLASKGAAVSMENPESSYLWSYLDFAADLPFEDVLFTPCLFGAEYQKPTRLRCWNWFPSSLANKRCTLVNGTFTCGRSREQGHRVLEFGGGSTKDAAAYVPGLCKAWAHDVREHFLTNPDRMDALAAVRRVSSGPVARHVFRGPTDESQHEHRAAEDAQCTAGCRNPSDLRDGWPELWDTMSVVRGVLDQAREFSTDLRDLAGCCGSDPRRAPPLEATIRAVRRGLERTLAVPEGTFEGHHHASPWRTDLVGTILYRANDPDVAIWSWLRDGAPMGLSQPIVPGTHFPRVDIDAEAKLADLDSRAPWCQNHPSFDLQHGSTRSPAWELLEEQVNEGFAWLFETRSAAEAFLDGPCHPAPLGNVSKTKEDGSVKHRLIQDLRANGVNTVVALPERQVLPRGIDHGADLACLGQCGVDDADDVDVFTLVLDFKNAFMSVPLHNDERRFNCANAGFTIRRAREPAYADEPDTGAFVVWASLGFGGRPNPLVFSRIASFAARTAQALLSPACRLQLYVDDPVISVRGSWAEASRELDLAIQWWLALGVPLAWAKGVVSTGTDPHRWIGVMYHLTPGGAVMRLPPDYVASLLAQLEPACSQRGKLSVHEVEVLCGKAGRVAHVVPSAHPFVSGLWGGLAAARALAKTKGDRFCFVPCRRLCFAASWLRALLLEAEDCTLRLERLVRPLSVAFSSSFRRLQHRVRREHLRWRGHPA